MMPAFVRTLDTGQDADLMPKLAQFPIVAPVLLSAVLDDTLLGESM